MSKNRSEMTYDELVEDKIWMEKIRQEYYEDIKSWDWQEIVDRAKSNVKYDPSSKRWEGIAYLGSCFTIMPSGKYLHLLSSNGNAEEFLKDEIFMEVLEEVAEEYDGYIFNGDYEPTNLYFGLDISLKPVKGTEFPIYGKEEVIARKLKLKASRTVTDGKSVDFIIPKEKFNERVFIDAVTSPLSSVFEPGFLYGSVDGEDAVLIRYTLAKQGKIRKITVLADVDDSSWQIIFWRTSCNVKKLSELSNATKLRIERILDKHFRQMPGELLFPFRMWISYVRREDKK